MGRVMQNTKQPTPGWYPDPRDLTEERYWDGTTWADDPVEIDLRDEIVIPEISIDFQLELRNRARARAAAGSPSFAPRDSWLPQPKSSFAQGSSLGTDTPAWGRRREAPVKGVPVPAPTAAFRRETLVNGGIVARCMVVAVGLLAVITSLMLVRHAAMSAPGRTEDVLVIRLVLATIGLSIASGLTFLSWLGMTTKQLGSLGRHHRRSTSWLILAWVIPIAQIVVPTRILAETWRLSSSSRRDPGSSTNLSTWGTLWVTMHLVGLLASLVSDAGPQLPIAATFLLLGVTTVPLVLSIRDIVTRVDRFTLSQGVVV